MLCVRVCCHSIANFACGRRTLGRRVEIHRVVLLSAWCSIIGAFFDPARVVFRRRFPVLDQAAQSNVSRERQRDLHDTVDPSVETNAATSGIIPAMNPARVACQIKD